eukprot:4287946-Prymnesium_polylepis.4
MATAGGGAGGSDTPCSRRKSEVDSSAGGAAAMVAPAVGLDASSWRERASPGAASSPVSSAFGAEPARSSRFFVTMLRRSITWSRLCWAGCGVGLWTESSPTNSKRATTRSRRVVRSENIRECALVARASRTRATFAALVDVHCGPRPTTQSPCTSSP